MKVFALGDLHLSFIGTITAENLADAAEFKPMGRFGPAWRQHAQKIYHNWRKVVTEEDVVLIPGDISWAMKLEQTKFDFAYLDLLPGKKVLVQGNHDYWWNSISKVRNSLPANCWAVQNDSVNFPGVTIAGTRGWLTPNDRMFSEHDQKIYRREVQRLEMSLSSVRQRQEKLVVMMHYMPSNQHHHRNELIELLVDYRVDICVYGHFHGAEAHNMRLSREKWGIEFYLVSADFANFVPQLILQL